MRRTKLLSVRVSAETHAALKDAAEFYGCSVSALLSRPIYQAAFGLRVRNASPVPEGAVRPAANIG